MVQPRRYRHCTDHEYEVRWPGIRKRKKELRSIVRSMATANYGLARQPCFWRPCLLMIVLVHGFSFLLFPMSLSEPFRSRLSGLSISSRDPIQIA